jgi:signal peptidase I
VTETPPETDAPEASAAPPRRRRWPRWVDLLAVGALLAVLAYLHLRVVRVAYVGTGSMLPTVEPGDRLLVHLGAYAKHPPRRGEVVAFWSAAESEYEVKRVIAVSGDTLWIGMGTVVLNDRPLHEPYVRQRMVWEQPLQVAIPDGELFVMGDNRNGSEDSRDYGPVRADQVLGRVRYCLLPPSRFGPVQ